MNKNKIQYADDATESISLLLRLRIPWLVVGLFFGAGLAIIVGRFERGLAENVALAFFMPFVVYMSDAVGTQTEAIYIRNAEKHRYAFGKYLVKEALLGLSLGGIFGVASFAFVQLWLNRIDVSATVGLAMFVNLSLAPIVALCIAVALRKERQDPALGSGPFATVIQDGLSLVIYFAIASTILI